MPSALTGDQQRFLAEQVKHIPEAVRSSFQHAFRAWKDTWFQGSLALSSNPATRAAGKEFETLRALGPQVLPLIVEQLALAENFLALQLYDVLQTNERLRVELSPTDPRIAEGEQGRARRTVEAWFTER